MNERTTDLQQRDMLISRVIDGSATAEDWALFRELAAQDASVWSDLSKAQRDHEALCEAMNAACAVADGVELPGGSGSSTVLERKMDGVARWGGWAAAVVLLIGWLTGFGPSFGKGGTQQAGLLPSASKSLETASSEEAFGRYLEAGQSNGFVVGEMPDHIVVETRPLMDGTIEVIYLRQVIERRVLDRAYRESVDEFGNPAVFPVDLSSLKQGQSF